GTEVLGDGAVPGAATGPGLPDASRAPGACTDKTVRLFAAESAVSSEAFDSFLFDPRASHSPQASKTKSPNTGAIQCARRAGRGLSTDVADLVSELGVKWPAPADRPRLLGVAYRPRLG